MGKMEEGKAILDEGRVAEVTKSLAKASVELVRLAGGACASTAAGILAETSQLKPNVIARLTYRKASTIRSDRGKVRKGHFGVFGNMTKARREFYLYRVKFYAVVDGKIVPVDSPRAQKEIMGRRFGKSGEGKRTQARANPIHYLHGQLHGVLQSIHSWVRRK
jgi:hypothetical protein